jgi:hypothetical protein
MEAAKSPLSYINAQSNRRLKQLIKQVLGYLLAIICLVWVFHDIRAEKLFEQLNAINWGVMGLAVFFDILSYVSQGWRWKLLLDRPMKHISLARSTQAIYAGLFTNEILPLRIGELVRTYLVSRWLAVDFISIIPSIIVERFFDGIWLAVCIGVTALFVNLPRDLIDSAEILGVIVLGATVFFIIMIVLRKKPHEGQKLKTASGWKPVRWIASLFEHFIKVIQEIGTSRNFYLSLMGSSLIIFFQILSFWLVMLACGMKLSLWGGAAVLLILHLGTLIPNAPSNVGLYQFFCVVGLSIFGIDKTTAAGFSVIAFIILTIPLWIIGLFAITRTGMTLKAIRFEVSKFRER